ncbi:MAG: hypothetical protein RLZZ234_341 [Candidatus Parcubacteria bacterium]|jgi:hypothetical protein
MAPDILAYNKAEKGEYAKICTSLQGLIDTHLKKSESKVWHRHPVWFLEGNPIVGYSHLKAGVRLMFWSGRDFEEPLLAPGTGKFKDASVTYTKASEIVEKDIKRWLKKGTLIQWDYKNIVKRKGKLVRLP